MPETLAQLGVLAVIVAIIAFAWYLIKALWRTARNVRVADVAYKAGAITDAAQRRASRVTQAFRDGRGR